MRLNDFNEYNISKKEFIEYYNRSLCLGLSICDDAVFKIYPSKYITVDIRNVKDKYVTIPSFVDSVVNLSQLWFSNRYIEVLDLNLVKTLGPFSLSSFRNLSLIKGDELLCIGKEALRECDSLSSVEFSKVRQIGEKAFFYCKHLSSLKLPNLLYAGRNWLADCTSLSYLSVPSLRTMKFLGYNLNRRVLDLDYTSPMLIEVQDALFKNAKTGEVFNWRGQVFPDFTRESCGRIISTDYTDLCLKDYVFDYKKYKELSNEYKTNKYGYMYNYI